MGMMTLVQEVLLLLYIFSKVVQTPNIRVLLKPNSHLLPLDKNAQQTSASYSSSTREHDHELDLFPSATADLVKFECCNIPSYDHEMMIFKISVKDARIC
jgi:hypothetical protein